MQSWLLNSIVVDLPVTVSTVTFASSLHAPFDHQCCSKTNPIFWLPCLKAFPVMAWIRGPVSTVTAVTPAAKAHRTPEKIWADFGPLKAEEAFAS
jgi:hypothetical protein